MRLSLCAAVTATLAAASAASATPTYSAARTTACLTAAGARIARGQDDYVTLNYPEIKQQIFWDFRVPNASQGEIIMFTSSATNASHLVARLLRARFSFGATKAEARRMVGSSGNAVWLSDFGRFAALSTKRTSLLKHCLK